MCHLEPMTLSVFTQCRHLCHRRILIEDVHEVLGRAKVHLAKLNLVRLVKLPHQDVRHRSRRRLARGLARHRNRDLLHDRPRRRLGPVDKLDVQILEVHTGEHVEPLRNGWKLM